MLLYQILVCTSHGKIKKKINKKTMNLKYQLQDGLKNLIYLMDPILYQTYKIILNTF